MTISSLFKRFLFIITIVLFASCDDDFNELGSDIIQDDIHHNGLDSIHAFVSAYDRATGAVQSNNMPLNAMGIYDNPAFGKTVSSFVAQLQFASGLQNPAFSQPELDSAYVYIPYFSKITSTATDGSNTYELDSVYGDLNASFRLSIYENRYFLRDSDPAASFLAQQKYFSDEKSLIDSNKGQKLNNDSDVTQNEEFKISASEIVRKDTTGKVIERLAPGIFVSLDSEFFKQKIFNAPAGSLTNNNVFKNYLRGLYFKIEQTGDNGAMALLDLTKGAVILKYGDVTTISSDQQDVKRTIRLGMNGNTVNFFENSYKPVFTDAIATFNDVTGDDRLYIKGGEGSMSVVDILDTDDLAFLKPDGGGNRTLINDASLTFFVDKEAMANTQEPLRVYLYDLTNKRPLFDYYVDLTSNTTYPKLDKSVHGGLIQKDGDGRALGYKLRITNHINNIVNKDSTNVKLGLVVSESINNINNAALKTYYSTGSQQVSTVPVASVINPLGTILYGTGPNVPAGKKLKLEIFYTKPN